MSARNKPESQLHFLFFFPDFLFKAKQARVFLTVGFGFALPIPQHVKRGADACGNTGDRAIETGQQGC